MLAIFLSYNTYQKAGDDMVIGIIGGGASGMCAALAAARNPQAEVIVFERQARLGRKLLATGNGRCNLTNMNAAADAYHGKQPEFVRAALSAFPVQKTLQWFRGMGLFTVAEDSGRVYPYSDQANSVVDVLRYAMAKSNIRLILGTAVSKVRKVGECFCVECQDEKFPCDRVIIACGGLAGTKLGGSMSGYKLLKAMGHSVSKLRPALVQLKSSWKGCVSLKGVRANCHVTILQDGTPFAQSQGELQFTEYGISGPVIFEVSRDACAEKGVWEAKLDFLPDISMKELCAELENRMQRELNAEDILTGILHNRLGRVLVSAAGIAATLPVSQLKKGQIDDICCLVKGLEIALTDTMGMDSAQVTAGGVLTADFNPVTLQSRLVPGLYACGEVLDVDGDCGGYNLQWAWSSGYVAGCSAGEVSL